MPEERDRILGELAVEHGLLSREEAARYYSLLDAQPGGPPLAQLLVRDARATQEDLKRLREIWQARAAVAAVATPPAPPPPEPGLDGESLRKDEALARVLVSRNVLAPDRAREARATQLREKQRLGPILVRGGFATRTDVEDAIRFLRQQALLCPTCGAIHEKATVGPKPVCTKCGSPLVPAVSDESSRIARPTISPPTTPTATSPPSAQPTISRPAPPPPPPPPPSPEPVRRPTRPIGPAVAPFSPLESFPPPSRPSRELGPGGEDPEAETARGMLREQPSPPLPPAVRLASPGPLDPFSSVKAAPDPAGHSPAQAPPEGWLDSREGPAFEIPGTERVRSALERGELKLDVGASQDELRFSTPAFARRPGPPPAASPLLGEIGPDSSSKRGPASDLRGPASSDLRRGPGSSNVKRGPGSSNVKRGPGSSNVKRAPGSSSVNRGPGSALARAGSEPSPGKGAWTPSPDGQGPPKAWTPSPVDAPAGGGSWTPFPGGDGAGAFPPSPGSPAAPWNPSGGEPASWNPPGDDAAPRTRVDHVPPASPKVPNPKKLEALKARGTTGPRRPPPPPRDAKPLVPVWVWVAGGAVLVLGVVAGLIVWVMKS